MAALLSVAGFGLQFPGADAPVIEGLDLSISSHEFVALVGGSGVGKSTLLRAVAGLVAPTAGRIKVDVALTPGQRRRAIVFQDARLMPWRTLAENIGYGLEGLNLPANERGARIAETLRLTMLEELADRYPHQLSGGQAQRGGIARALAVRPDLLLMDEPFSAVDALTRTTLQDELIRIWTASRAAVLFVTHDIAEAVYLADRVVVLGGAPAGIRLDQAIDVPRPRDRADPALADLGRKIGAVL